MNYTINTTTQNGQVYINKQDLIATLYKFISIENADKKIVKFIKYFISLLEVLN